MNGREIIKDILTNKGITNSTYARELSITSAALWDRLDTQPRKGKARKDIPVSLLADMVDVLGYKLVVIPKEEDVAESWYEVDKL